jgi:hypothetical protein
MGSVRTISCAHDNDLAKQIYAYTSSEANFKQIVVQNSLSAEHLSLVEDEITVQEDSLVTLKDARVILELYIKANRDRMKDYHIIESVGILIVSKIMMPTDVVDGMLTCDFCGYFTPYWEDLSNHKIMHVAYSKSR